MPGLCLKKVSFIVGLAWCCTVDSKDFLCDEIVLPKNGVVQPQIHALVDFSNTSSLSGPLNNSLTELSLSKLLFAAAPLRQINVEDAINEAQNNDTGLSFSSAEKTRQKESSVCDKAYNRLVKAFSDNRKAIDFPEGLNDTDGLARFIPWYLDRNISQLHLNRAKPIVDAQINYSQVCLASDVPSEMSPDMVKRAVGLLTFGDQPFCGALRAGVSDVITAQHCFRNPETGELLPQTMAVLSGQGQMWFSYEAEPNNRYEVCRSSFLLKTGKVLFLPYSDNQKITIAKTQQPVSLWNWSSLPLKSGTSLYLRGYFPFTSDSSTLSHMRATAHGGCASFGANDRCLFNACQSTPIMSGAPVFVRPEPGKTQDTLEIVGLHLGVATIASKGASGGEVCEGSDGRKFEKSNFTYQPKGYEK